MNTNIQLAYAIYGLAEVIANYAANIVYLCNCDHESWANDTHRAVYFAANAVGSKHDLAKRPSEELQSWLSRLVAASAIRDKEMQDIIQKAINTFIPQRGKRAASDKRVAALQQAFAEAFDKAMKG